MTLFEKRDRLIKEVIKPLFKENGFRVPGNTFRKSETNFIKIFNIQSSAWNLDDHVSFYLNIGFLFPIYFEVTDQPLPKQPKEYDCIFRIRTDSLTGLNQSYEISPKTEFEELKELIESDLTQFVFPFFERYKNIEDCLNLNKEFEDQHAPVEPYVALTLIKNNEFEKGNRILDEFIKTTHDEYANTLNEYRKRVNIDKRP